MNLRRLRAVFGIDKNDTAAVLLRAWAMYNGLNADKVTYSAPNPPLPAFLTLIVNLTGAQQLVPSGTKGMAATRDVQRALLYTGMETERMVVQTLADASPLHAAALIENAGLLVASFPVHPKGLLTLAVGKQSGSVICDANVGLLVGAGALKPNQARFFNWSYTLDGAKTFVSAPPTPTGKTTLQGLPPLTLVGVRVNLNNMSGPGEWSQIVTILVR